MKKPTVSLCMIVKNEEKNLEKCLTTIQSIVDEIIIIDTGSTDLTIDIAERFNAKVFNFQWVNDFSEARNFSLNFAKSDYILVLDADEFIEDKESILQDLQKQKDYYINRIKNYSTGGFVRYHEAIRLFKNHIGLKYFGSIHEHLNIQNGINQYTFGYSDILIGHTGYKEEVIIEKDKKNRNLKLLLEEVKKNPTSYNYFNLAKQYKQLGEVSKAIECFKESYAISKNMSYVNELLFHLGDCLRQQKRYEEGLLVLKDAINLFPDYTDLYFEQGRIFLEYGYFNEAQVTFEKCLELGEVKQTASTEGVGSFWAYYYMSEAQIKQGNKLEALESLFQAIKLKQHFYIALESYINQMEMAKINSNELFSLLNQLYVISNQDDLKFIIQLLYNLRSPVLQKYIEEYNIKVDDGIHAIGYEYDKQYNKAFEFWSKKGILEEEHMIDILLLSMIMENDDLLKKYKSHLNINQKDWKVINKLVKQDYVGIKKLNENNEKLIIKISEKLMILQEFDVFHSLSKWFSMCSTTSQLIISKTLDLYGYTDASFNLVTKILESNKKNLDAIEFLGDLYFKSGYYEESLTQYNYILNTKIEYNIYRKVYCVYQIKQDINELNTLSKVIRGHYQFSNIQSL